MKNIYIFASPSSKPDLYINIINYWVDTYGIEELGGISLLRIQDGKLKDSEIKEGLEYTRECIEKQMYFLIGGNYLIWDPRQNKFSNEDYPKKITISKEFKKTYKDSFALISQKGIQINILNREKLGDEINELFSDEFEENFDVTGVINRYLVQISAFLLARNHSLYSLEVHKRFSHNEEDLIHNLKPEDYTYHFLGIPKEIEIQLVNQKVGKEENLKISNAIESYQTSRMKWLSQLAKDRTKVVIEELLNFSFEVNNDIIIKEAVHQSSRWERLNKRISDGIYSDDFVMREQRKITSSIIDLIQRMGEIIEDMR